MFSTRKTVLFIILLIAICSSIYFIVIFIPSKTYDGAKQVGRDIREAFQFTPEIKVNNTIVLQQQAPILELATLSQKFQHHYEWLNTWMGSTKKIYITGSFEAKAGYDLRKKFSIEITDDHAIVSLPEPQLLSLQSLGDMKFQDEHGVWNWVNQDDRSKAINEFTGDARKYAMKAAFIQDAKTKTEEQLTKILQAHVSKVDFHYTESLNREQ